MSQRHKEMLLKLVILPIPESASSPISKNGSLIHSIVQSVNLEDMSTNSFLPPSMGNQTLPILLPPSLSFASPVSTSLYLHFTAQLLVIIISGLLQ